MKGRIFIIDTNVLVSFLLFANSTPAKAVEEVMRHGVLLISPETYAELCEVLRRRKFDKYVSISLREELLEALFHKAICCETNSQIDICRDHKDNMFLDLAYDNGAESIITGDDDLLSIKQIKETRIITPKDFLDNLRNPDNNSIT